VGAFGIEPKRCTRHAWSTATPGATPVCAPENEKAAEEDLSRAAPDRFGYSAYSMRLEPSLRRSWAAARA